MLDKLQVGMWGCVGGEEAKTKIHSSTHPMTDLPRKGVALTVNNQSVGQLLAKGLGIPYSHGLCTVCATFLSHV